MPKELRVLLVEDDPAVRFGAAQALELAGLTVEAFDAADALRPHLHPHLPAVIVTDVRMKGMSGLELLDYAIAIDADLPIIVITGHGDISMAVDAMRRGAYDFLEKPFASDQLVGTVHRALEKRRLTFEVQNLRRKLEDRQGIESILIGGSPAMEQLRRTILALGEAAPDVLIFGETGTGKELVAQCLHQYSSRRFGNMVALNCGALPETMIESELFGHEAGAFTGALKKRIGKIEHAKAGTVFLDEIESMPLVMQVKLLRAIQERSVVRLGANEPITVDVRFVAATKTDLKMLSDSGKFRADLYYRLNVVRLDLPSLRERREDIPLLFEHFCLQAASRYRCQAPLPSPGLLQALMAYTWPGNIRELRNIADRFVLGVLGALLGADNLSGIDAAADAHSAQKSLTTQVEDFERSLIIDQLRRDHGNVAATSEALALPKKTLYDKIKKYNIALDELR